MFDTPNITHVHLDLNLLVAFDVLLEEGSVGGAADRLHLSQPAMSRTLGRLRRATGDQILVRSGRAMVPTPYAVRVRDEIHTLLQQVRDVLTPARELDLATLDQTFTLQCHDAITNALGPRLLAAVRGTAPGVRLRLLGEPTADTDALRAGLVDLEIGSSGSKTPDVRAETVGSSRLVVALRPAHPLAGAPVTLEGYAAAEHVTVSRRGRLADPIDTVLEDQGRRRTVVAAAPTSTAALHIARSTDTLVAVPGSICRADIEAAGLSTTAMPVELPPVPVILLWHQRHDDDPAHTWLRLLVLDTLHQLLTEHDPAAR